MKQKPCDLLPKFDHTEPLNDNNFIIRKAQNTIVEQLRKFAENERHNELERIKKSVNEGMSNFRIRKLSKHHAGTLNP